MMSQSDDGNRCIAEYEAQGPTTTGLLVSVRSMEEASAIADLPLDVLDLKEPHNGPLGPCDPDLWRECVESVRFPGQWSVALGESATASKLAKLVPPGIDFAKAGPAGLRSESELLRLWDAVRADLCASVQLVAVAYADYDALGGISPERTIELARSRGISTVLVDTFAKMRRSSVDVLGASRIAAVVADAEEAGCRLVLSGGLGFDSLRDAVSAGAHRVGVRGAVCHRGGRTSRIDPSSVRRWIEFLRGARSDIEGELRT